MRHASIPFRLTPVAAAVLVVHVASANTLTVTNCLDDGSAGTLRNAISTAAAGDTVDLTQLKCSVISLTTGVTAHPPLAVNQAAGVDGIGLKIVGPGAENLAIVGTNFDRVISHGGAGALEIDGVTIQNGYLDTAYKSNHPKGGCIASYSANGLILNDTKITNCTVYNKTTDTPAGGGIYAKNLTLSHSSVTNSTLQIAAGAGAGNGGGIYVAGPVVLHSSTVSNNKTLDGYGGGIYTKNGTFSSEYSSISSNQAKGSAGLSIAYDFKASIASTTIADNIGVNGTVKKLGGLTMFGVASVLLQNSTISGNSAGGAVMLAGKANVQNCTIAFNGTVGVVVGYGSADFESTILANNILYDLYDVNGHPSSISGADNLVMTTSALPPTTPATFFASHADPNLGPLANNGGPTLTHALAAGSPALGAGNDVGGSTFDQRGPLYPRTSGSHVDIGAVQFDSIFADGYEGTP